MNAVLIIMGNMLTSLGNSMYVVALIIFVSDTYPDPLYIGLIQAAVYLPVILFSLEGGKRADRSRRPPLIAGTDLIRSLFLAAGAMLLSGVANIHPLAVILPMVFLNAVMQAHFSPAVISFILDQKKTKIDLLGLRTGSGHLASLAGQSLGALLYPVLGLVPTLFTNSLCFLTSGISELFLTETEARCLKTDKEIASKKITLSSVIGEFKDLDKKNVPVLLYIGMQAVNSLIILNLPFFITRRLGFESRYIGYGLAALMGGSILIGFIVGISGLATRVSSKTTIAAAGIAFIVYIFAARLSFINPVGLDFFLPCILLIICGASLGWIHLVTVHQVFTNGPPNSAATRQGFLEAVATAVLPVSYIIGGLLASKLSLDTPWMLRLAAILCGLLIIAETARISKKHVAET